MERYKYNIGDVSDLTLGPIAFGATLWLEHKLIREVLKSYRMPMQLGRAAELGAGYGRMTPALAEFYSQVIGYEREREFVEAANQIYKDKVSFVHYEHVGRIPCPSEYFDLVMTFTFLQHLHSDELSHAVAEIKRMIKPTGLILLVEECEAHESGHVEGNKKSHCCFGRSVEAYSDLFTGFKLLETKRRESLVLSRDVGRLMLFQKDEK